MLRRSASFQQALFYDEKVVYQNFVFLMNISDTQKTLYEIKN